MTNDQNLSGAIWYSGMANLTPKQARFVAEYLIDLNATQAAIRAGYSATWAEKNAHRLTGNDGVSAAIADGQAKAMGQAGVTAQRVKEELARLAFSDVRRLFDKRGNLRPIYELGDNEAAAVASLEVVIKNAAAGDGHTDTIHKVKVWDKTKALELLGKHFGLFDEHAHISGTIELVWGGQ